MRVRIRVRVRVIVMMLAGHGEEERVGERGVLQEVRHGEGHDDVQAGRADAQQQVRVAQQAAQQAEQRDAAADDAEQRTEEAQLLEGCGGGGGCG